MLRLNAAPFALPLLAACHPTFGQWVVGTWAFIPGATAPDEPYLVTFASDGTYAAVLPSACAVDGTPPGHAELGCEAEGTWQARLGTLDEDDAPVFDPSGVDLLTITNEHADTTRYAQRVKLVRAFRWTVYAERTPFPDRFETPDPRAGDTGG